MPVSDCSTPSCRSRDTRIAIFMHGELADALGEVQLAERAADFAGHERQHRRKVGRRRFQAGEVHTASDLFSFK